MDCGCRKQRRSFPQPRLRRESYGELIQIDGSDPRWFEERGAACSLPVFIDDATGKLNAVALRAEREHVVLLRLPPRIS